MREKSVPKGNVTNIKDGKEDSTHGVCVWGGGDACMHTYQEKKKEGEKNRHEEL